MLAQPGQAQFISPFVGNLAVRTPDRPVAAREPWSAAEHAAVIESAIEASAALADGARARMLMRLAILLDQTGDHGAEARVLRLVADTPDKTGVRLEDLAERLVQAGEIDEVRKLASAPLGANETQQVLTGMLNGAIKARKLDIGLEALLLAKQLPRQFDVDPFAFQAQTLADALAQAGRYREALAALPSSSPLYGATLPKIVTKACLADPSLADQASKMAAATALKAAFLNLATGMQVVAAVRAFAACRGEAAARRLIALMPPDIASEVSLEPPHPAPSTDASQLAADALSASRSADAAKADALFAAAKARLDTEASGRGASREARQRFDASARLVAISMTKADRQAAAVALVAALPALERLPILFAVTRTAVESSADPAASVAAIDDAFAGEPALVGIEAGEIRTLRGALPLGSPVYSKIKPWLDALPTAEGAKPAPSPQRLSKPADLVMPLISALEKAAPSTVVIQRVLLEARRGQIGQAIGDARSLSLTPSEAGVLQIARDFINALPEQVLTSFAAVEVDGMGTRQALAITPVDGLLITVERVALAKSDLAGARAAYAAVGAESPAKRAALALLAIGEARMGLPRSALEAWSQITDPLASSAVLCAIVAVRPAT